MGGISEKTMKDWRLCLDIYHEEVEKAKEFKGFLSQNYYYQRVANRMGWKPETVRKKYNDFINGKFPEYAFC